ncbi:MAG: ABC transporter permease [Verrucomicrobia bacterium]|nr:ABC transporter permease [Verrucomicrobiota bacterium]MDA1067459.1 ABC transporter permease [Verrucomicrobiota bacterium]
MKKNRLFDALLWLVLLWAFIGLFYTPYDPQSQAFTEDRLTGPTASHLLGIDGLGRDLFSRIWLGSGHSIGMGVLATLGNLSLAGLLLFLEQKSPGWVSRFLLSFISGWLAIPVLFIALLLLVYFDQGPRTLIVAAALGNVPFTFRQLRVLWRHQRETLYVQASRVLGSRSWNLFRKTIWPNLRPDVVGLSKLIFAFSLLEVSGLAFLGLIGDPDFAELGSILRQNKSYLLADPWQVIWPGAFLSAVLWLVQLSRSEAE